MTEDEAKTKWCPFARTLGTLRQPAQPGADDYVVGHGGQNRGSTMGGPLHNCMCIGSACMAWRNQHDFNAGTLAYDTGGFCGLAGKP